MKGEFSNHNNFVVKIPDRNGRLIVLRPGQKAILDIFFKRYVPRQLTLRRLLNDDGTPIVSDKNTIIQNNSKNVVIKKSIKSPIAKKQQLAVPKKAPIIREQRKVVGHQSHNGRQATEFSASRLAVNDIAISNNIGVGILSYNRLGALSHLIASIRRNTNLLRTSIFVSDESTDSHVWDWLQNQKDITSVKGGRLGIAGNSNRLLRCLDRFKYKLILNDDVEILKEGWEKFYFDAMVKTGIKHFCYRQSGVYGAVRPQPDDSGVITVNEKPHGAVMAIHDDAFRKVGYFDEEFGIYGLEHVDYSDRISRAGLAPNGYHDYIGSDQYFKIHDDQSAAGEKLQSLNQAKKRYQEVRNDRSRLYVGTSEKTKCPSISCVIPYRDIDRASCLASVVNCIRAQRFPVIQIVLVEQDQSQRVNLKDFPCVDYHFVPNKFDGMHFCKAMAFNLGVAKSNYENIVMHDADMLVRLDYFQMIDKLLLDHESAHIGSTVCYMDQSCTNRIVSEFKIDRSTVSSDRIVTYYEGGSFGIKKSAYARIGGFIEDFIGYGCEDCEFFARMKDLTKLFNQRSVDLFHLWHGRTPGWEECHERNKKIHERLVQEGLPVVARRYSQLYINKYLQS